MMPFVVFASLFPSRSVVNKLQSARWNENARHCSNIKKHEHHRKLWLRISHRDLLLYMESGLKILVRFRGSQIVYTNKFIGMKDFVSGSYDFNKFYSKVLMNFTKFMKQHRNIYKISDIDLQTNTLVLNNKRFIFNFLNFCLKKSQHLLLSYLFLILDLANKNQKPVK